MALQMVGMGWVGEDLWVNSSTSMVTLNSGNELESIVGASVVESGSCVGISVRVLSKTSVGIIVSRDCQISGNSVGWKGSWDRYSCIVVDTLRKPSSRLSSCFFFLDPFLPLPLRFPLPLEPLSLFFLFFLPFLSFLERSLGSSGCSLCIKMPDESLEFFYTEGNLR